MKETYRKPIEKVGNREPSGSGIVWRAFNTTYESGVLTARLATLFDPLVLQERRDLLQHAHFPAKFLQEKDEYYLRGNGHDIAVNVIGEALEHGYPANVLVVQLAGVDSLLPFLPMYWRDQLNESMPKLLQSEPTIQETMRRHENMR